MPEAAVGSIAKGRQLMETQRGARFLGNIYI